MLSKIYPWDFIQKYPVTLIPSSLGIHSFLVDDPFVERVILDRLPRKEIKYDFYTGSEVTRDFIEEHFINLSFFTSNNPILIMNAEAIPALSLSFLLEENIDWSDRLIILFFTKTSKGITEFNKNKKVQAFEFSSPLPWDGPKIWQFCQKVRGLNLDGTVTRFVLENLEHNYESFFSVIDTIKTNFPEGIVNFKTLQTLVSKERWDFFLLIDLFHKDPKIFFAEILKKEIDYDWIRNLSASMHGHIVKVLFPEEILKKDKYSKYDQTVLEMNKLLSRDVLKYYLEFFLELEISAKASDLLLVNRLKLELF
jgi:hypothetical protein